MARRGEIYSSGWIKASDLLDTGHPNGLDLTIKNIRTSEMDDGKVQRTLSFEEDDRELGLNVTNWDSLADLFKADDDDAWVGKVCNIHPHKLDRPYNGKTHGVRVGAPRGIGPAKTASAPSAPAMPLSQQDWNFKTAIDQIATVGMTKEELIRHLKDNGHDAWVAAKCTPLVKQWISERQVPPAGPHKSIDDDNIPF